MAEFTSNSASLAEEIRKEVGIAISNDLTAKKLQKFLNSNQNDKPKSIDQIKKWHVWWRQVLPGEEARGVCPANILSFENKNDAAVREYLKHSFQGVTLNGQPIYWELQGEVSRRFSDLKKVVSVDDMLAFHVRQELLSEQCCDYQSNVTGKSIGKVLKIVDMTGMSMVPDSKELEYIQKMIGIDESYFPDCTEALVFINAPWYFSTFFNIVKVFMSEKTASKIVICTSSFLPHLLTRVDANQLPEMFGGTHKEYVWQHPFPENTGVSPEQMAAHLVLLLEQAEKNANRVE